MQLLGCRPDAPDARDWRFVDSQICVRRPLTSAESIDFRPFDQQRVQISNSCVGQSIAAAAALAMVIQGRPIAFPSALFAYTGARLLGDPTPKDPSQPRLIDHGCSFRFAMKWLAERGLVAETRWPEVPAYINAVPALDVWQEGECATLDAYYRIDAGPSASDAMRIALRRGYCPIFAMRVDDKFGALRSEVYDSHGGAVWGGHAMVVVGYSSILDAFLVRNTWGKDWGMEGYGWISSTFMNANAFDLWVIEASPEVR